MEILPTGLFCLQYFSVIRRLTYLRNNGLECFAVCSLDVLSSAPEIGSVIKVKHNGNFANGGLRHAYFWTEIPSVSWQAISKETRVLVMHVLLKF